MGGEVSTRLRCPPPPSTCTRTAAHRARASQPRAYSSSGRQGKQMSLWGQSLMGQRESEKSCQRIITPPPLLRISTSLGCKLVPGLRMKSPLSGVTVTYGGLEVLSVFFGMANRYRHALRAGLCAARRSLPVPTNYHCDHIT